MQDKIETKKDINCALYTRVSTDGQADIEFNSCEAQEQKLKSFIDSQENFRLFKSYSDPGYSGANLDRPGLSQLLHDVQSGNIDIILTYKIDRLTRSPKDFYQLIEIFEHHNASYISITERFDTSTPSGRLLRNIMLTFAQFERELTSERIRDKIHQKAIKGLPNGGCTTFGYYRKDKNLVIHEENAKIVKMIFDLYISTNSSHKIRDILREKKIFNKKGNPYTNSFVQELLRNPVLTGKIRHAGKLYPAQYPSIISEELFNHVQTLHKKGYKKSRLHKTLPYVGLIKCDECGSFMTPCFTNKYSKKGLTKYYYYRCSKLSHYPKSICSTRQISADRFHNIIFTNFKRLSMDNDYLKNFVFSLKFLDKAPHNGGFEPDETYKDLTAEKLQNSLNHFLKEYARRKGFDQSLAVSHSIKKIIYSKKKISVELFYNRSSDDDFAR
ncbi:MAG: recombinase family protein, partial [bacterium]